MSNSKFAAAAKKIDPDPYQGGFTVSLLTHEDIPAFLAIQDACREVLPDDLKHHLKERTFEDLVHHLDSGMPLIGVKTDNGILAGQILMSFPTNQAAKNLDGYPIRTGQENVTAIVQSVAIHPDFRGPLYGLSKILHDRVLELAQEYQQTRLIAKVSDTNPASQKSFMNNGFTEAAKGEDPVKHYKVTFFAKDVSLGANGCGAASATLVLVRQIA